MAATGPNFVKILSETIRRAGVENDFTARASIYQRARRTVVERARAGGVDDIDEIEHDLDVAIAEVESGFGLLAGQPASGATGGGAAVLPGADRPDVPRGRPGEAVALKQSGGAALAMSMPESDEETAPTAAPAVDTPPEPEPAETTAEVETGRTNVFPLWRRLKAGRAEALPAEPAPSTEPEPGTDRELEAESTLVRADGNHTALFTRRVADLESDAETAPREDDLDDAMYARGDPLERVAADLAAGFAVAEKTDRPAGGADARRDELGLAEPDEALVRDVGRLVGHERNDNEPARSESRPAGWRRTLSRLRVPDLGGLAALPSLPKLRLPQWRRGTGDTAALSGRSRPQVNAGSLVFLGLLIVAGGSAAYFAVNPQPADPNLLTVGSGGGLIPDARALDGEGWVARDVEIEPVTGADWPGFVVRDDSAERFGTLSAPLNDVAAPNGFKVSTRFAKSNQRLPHFAAIRVTAPYTRRAYTVGAAIDLSTGEVAASDKATDEDVVVVDDGDTWLLTLDARLDGNVLFSKPRLEIFPAAGTELGNFSAGATGAVTVGDITVRRR